MLPWEQRVDWRVGGGGRRRGKGRGCGSARVWVWGTCSWRLGKSERRRGRGGGWRWRGWEVGRGGRGWSRGRETRRGERDLSGQAEAEKKTEVESFEQWVLERHKTLQNHLLLDGVAVWAD